MNREGEGGGEMNEGKVFSVNVSAGGVPQRPIASAAIRLDGVQGDRQRDLRYHGGRDRAVLLYSLELIRLLQAEGHAITPGSIGENLTLTGFDWAAMKPGLQLEIGEVLLEITKEAPPCAKISGSFQSGRFSRVSEKEHPGWSRFCARVLREGTVAGGDRVAAVATSQRD
jgi:MOSC domain-containing protein YiiM